MYNVRVCFKSPGVFHPRIGKIRRNLTNLVITKIAIRVTFFSETPRRIFASMYTELLNLFNENTDNTQVTVVGEFAFYEFYEF